MSVTVARCDAGCWPVIAVILTLFVSWKCSDIRSDLKELGGKLDEMGARLDVAPVGSGAERGR